MRNRVRFYCPAELLPAIECQVGGALHSLFGAYTAVCLQLREGGQGFASTSTATSTLYQGGPDLALIRVDIIISIRIQLLYCR